MKTYRVAVGGLGRMGSTIDISIANACAASDRLELGAGADTLPERRDAFAGTSLAETAYGWPDLAAATVIWPDD
ncbi:MAG: hypothetical protein IH926_11090 [Proteobacteria bacterium]|nr:hypothetical protein [Pseudomonadota bacterium]